MTAPRGGGPARSPGPSGGARGAIVIGLAVILGIVGLQILDDSDSGSGNATGTTSSATSSTTASTTPVRQPNEVRVKVYNASGIQGKAQTLTDQLRAKGYNMQSPTTLNKQQQGTVVACTSGFDREGKLLAVYGVDNGAQAVAYPSDPPEGASDADCLVIIGT